MKHPTLGSSSGHDLMDHGFKPASGSVLTVWSLLGILSLLLSLPLLCSFCLSLKINKLEKYFFKNGHNPSMYFMGTAVKMK